MKKGFRLTERFKYFLERQFVKGAHYQLLFVAALIGLISIIGGILVLPTGEPLDDLGESIWWAFLRLSDPGYLGDDEGAWRRIISTIITVAGYVVFLGALVAIITTWLHSKMRNLEQGLTPIAAENHILILGWTNRTIPIAGELFQSVVRLKRFLKRVGSRNLQLIILADDVTPDRLQELKDDELIGKRAHDIILRSGTPLDNEHLERVDSSRASAIIIPSHSTGPQDLINSDVETIKTLLSLNEHPKTKQKSSLPFVVAEIQDERKRRAAHRAYAGPLEAIASDSIISRLIAQNVRHPQLSDVYNQLLSRSKSNNIFVREHPETIGKTLAELAPSFPNTIIIGVVRRENNDLVPYLNMPGDFEVKNNDRLVFMARSFEDTDCKEIISASHLQIEHRTSKKEPLKHREVSVDKNVLILGWNHRIPALINEFSTYKKEKYEVDIVSVTPADKRNKAMELFGLSSSNVTYTQIESDFVTETELQWINPAGYDNIILANSERLENEEADARSIVGYILLEEILKQEESNPQILLELSDPDNEVLMSGYDNEVIISPMILSHLLAQVALRRELHTIYNELFTVGGAEIIFRDPEDYELDQESLKFSELRKIAAEYGETALGVYFQNDSHTGQTSLQLNPSLNQKIDLSPKNGKLVVMTTY
ncbi:ion channel DMI1 [Aliifodinibius salipaludis]|uniref:Ion channel DMI1 n=1 Tax=Fodinibius salipaludis TaxID=2032627 RepID=A0A2A2GBT3_9BACT|nr:ion channel DMI1 [Aliifodinibius salipaludis]PAU94808.1 ion channel DMI1 [Aliifodinibius salipaludis]